jgi:endoglucanase
MSPRKSLETAFYRYEITGADWAQSLAAGQAMTVGFNALSGEDLSGNATFTSELLMASGSELMLL